MVVQSGDKKLAIVGLDLVKYRLDLSDKKSPPHFEVRWTRAEQLVEEDQ
jgi:hypothetical protein